LEAPGDVVTAERTDQPGVQLIEVSGDDGRLPRSPEENTASVAAKELLDIMVPAEDSDLGVGGGGGIGLRLEKGLPLESGLGSSAASAVAAVIATNELLQLEASPETLLRAALAGERRVSGSPHPDNAAACLFGGLVLVRSVGPLDVVELPVPANATVTLVRPHLKMNTQQARALLGEQIALRDAVTQWANVGAFVSGLYREDWGLISRAVRDVVAEPVRSPLVPGFAEVKRAAIDAGAAGVSLSGSGPSVFALCRNETTARKAGSAMQRAFLESASLASDIYVSPAGAPGARLLDTEAL
jgi:homoserine kinase